MSYNRQAIADALAKMNKAKKPKQPKDIIKDPEGQYKYPGTPTRIASDNITMQGVPFPVLGVDDLGNQQMMQPGAEYIFPGADYVDEFPMMQGGGQKKPIYVTNPKDPRLIAYQDSLGRYNNSQFNIQLANNEPTLRKYTTNITQQEKKDLIDNINYGKPSRNIPVDYMTYRVKPSTRTNASGSYSLTTEGTSFFTHPDIRGVYGNPQGVPNPILYNRSGNNMESYFALPVYKKPQQPVIFKPDPEIVAKQEELIAAGYNIGKPDGIWGPKSEAAWKEYQNKVENQPTETSTQSNSTSGVPPLDVAPIDNPAVTPQTVSPQGSQQPSNTPQQVPAAPQPPIGYNVWTHNGQPLDPTIYGWAPSDSPRQISQFASTHALERANKAYTKLNATPWATEGNKLVTDLYKPYFSKTAATNALVPTAEQLGVSVDQLRIEKAPVGYSGYVVIQKLPQQKYGGLVTGLTNTSGNLLMNEQGKRMMAQSGSLFATNKMFLGNPMVTKRKKSVFVPGAPFQEGGDTSNPGMDAMMKARFAYAHMHGNPAAQRMTYPVDNPYIFTGTEPYTNPDMAGEFGTHYMFSQDNYAVPTIQQDEYGNLIYSPEANYTNPEAIQFDRPEDAEYFAKYYKQIAPGMQTGGSTNWKSKIASAINFQKGGQKDKWGRSPESKWYGFNPKTKQWTKKLKENKKDYFQQSLNKQLNQAQPSETIQQSRGQTIESQKAAEDTQEILRKERNKQATLPKNFEADTRSDAQRERDQTAAEQLTDPNLKQQIANALQAPLFQAGNFWDYLAGGDDWKQAQQEYNLNQLNPYSQNKMSNFLSTGLSNTGNALMTGMEIADGYALARAIPGIQNQVGRYLTNQTPLKNAYKINPWAFKSNPEASYRMLGKEGYTDLLESGVIRPKPGGFYDQPYFSRGEVLDNYGGPYMAEIQGHPMVKNNMAFYSPHSDVVIPRRQITIDNPGLKIYKQDWLRGYKPINTPRKLPGSPNIASSVDDIVRETVKAGFDGNFITRPLTPFTKNELTSGEQLYRKIGNKKGLQDLIDKQGAQAPSPLKMKSGVVVDTPFFGIGDKPNENYSGLFAVETKLPSKSKYDWTSRAGGVDNRGRSPVDKETGRLVKNIPIEDLNVYRKKWFSNNYKKIDPNNLQKELKTADAQFYIETLYKWGIRGVVLDQIINNGDYRKKMIDKLPPYMKEWNTSMWEELKQNVPVTGAAVSQFQQGGSIQPLDYFDIELTDQEIEQYKKGGCVVVKL